MLTEPHSLLVKAGSWAVVPLLGKGLKVQNTVWPMAEFVTSSAISPMGQIIFCSGVVLCVAGCLAIFLTFTHQMLVVTNTSFQL